MECNCCGHSPNSMFSAARDGDLVSLKICVEQLSKDEARRLTSVPNRGGLTPLVIACREGHVAVAEYLIDNCGADIELKGSMKCGAMELPPAPPLWFASASGHLNVVKCLVSRGANVNSVSGWGRSALHEASQNGDLGMVQYLVANGADEVRSALMATIARLESNQRQEGNGNSHDERNDQRQGGSNPTGSRRRRHAERKGLQPKTRK